MNWAKNFLDVSTLLVGRKGFEMCFYRWMDGSMDRCIHANG